VTNLRHVENLNDNQYQIPPPSSSTFHLKSNNTDAGQLHIPNINDLRETTINTSSNSDVLLAILQANGRYPAFGRPGRPPARNTAQRNVRTPIQSQYINIQPRAANPNVYSRQIPRRQFLSFQQPTRTTTSGIHFHDTIYRSSMLNIQARTVPRPVEQTGTLTTLEIPPEIRSQLRYTKHITGKKKKLKYHVDDEPLRPRLPPLPPIRYYLTPPISPPGASPEEPTTTTNFSRALNMSLASVPARTNWREPPVYRFQNSALNFDGKQHCEIDLTASDDDEYINAQEVEVHNHPSPKEMQSESEIQENVVADDSESEAEEDFQLWLSSRTILPALNAVTTQPQSQSQSTELSGNDGDGADCESIISVRAARIRLKASCDRIS
jgi:hypothetical protein